MVFQQRISRWLWLAAVISSCGAPATVSPPPAFTLASGQGANPTLMDGVTQTPVLDAAGYSDEAVLAQQAASEALSESIDVPLTSIQVVGTPQAEVWSDSSLGCPRPEESYLQVETPGFSIVFMVDGQTYDVHTDSSGNAVVCGGDANTVGGRDPIAAEFIADTRRDLTQRLNVTEAEITLVSSDSVTWSDTSLGCRIPGREYDAMQVAGYRIIFEVDEIRYTYHTDQQRFVFCLDPTE